MKNIRLLSFVLLFFFIFLSGISYASDFDIIIAGAGTGGCAAAIQAARNGASVALIEESDWLGGQMTGAAVCTMDDKGFTRTGIYKEFLEKVKAHYSAIGRETNICYWGSDTISFEPRTGHNILSGMLSDAGVTVYFRTRAVSAEVKDGRVISATFEKDKKSFTLRAEIFIDATEYGDFIPLTGASYRVGNSRSGSVDYSSIIQDITYPAVVKEYKKLPEELKLNTPPPGYLIYAEEFRRTITRNGAMWPGSYPFNIPSFKAYRAVPDPDSDLFIDGGKAETWNNITKTCLNWGNDFPGRTSRLKGLPVAFIEDRACRAVAVKEAMLKTLSFIYYMQHELGMENWSVDNGQEYGTWFSCDWYNNYDMKEFEPLLKHFPPFPYVRESRRIVSVKDVRMYDIERNPVLCRTEKSIPDAIALGEYPIDIHSVHDKSFMDSDLGERAEDIPDEWTGKGAVFQLPLGCLIPEKTDGLLAAEKNIGVSRTVNGATRLQPVTMLTGQACGALASIAVKRGVEPRNITPWDVQCTLWKAGVSLSIFRYKDNEPYMLWWEGVQAASVYGLMKGESEENFGSFNPVSWKTVCEALALLGVKTENIPEGSVTDRGFVCFAEKCFADNMAAAAMTRKMLGKYDNFSVMTRGRFAQYLYELMKIQREK